MKHFRHLSILFALLVLGSTMTHTESQAQDIQLHYDFGSALFPNDVPSRPKLTTTVEHFKGDKWGSTFYFVDMDYADGGVKSAYWELSREIRTWEAPVAVHLEYNGGLQNSFSYRDAYLFGASYTYHTSGYDFVLSLIPMYKYIRGNRVPHSFQFTTVWGYTFLRGLLSFNGFFDLWTDTDLKDTTPIVILTEPQIWLNLNAINGVSPDFNLSIGSEIELSYNFVDTRPFVFPTLALKWTF